MNRRSLAALAAIIPLCACGPSHDETPKINTYALDDDAALSCVPIDASSPEASPDVASDVPQDPRATTGEWSGVVSWPVVAVHSVLTYNAKIVTWPDFGSNAEVFDIATGARTTAPNLATDLFCAGHVSMFDGRVLIIGGTSAGGGAPGINLTTYFNPATLTWGAGPAMHSPRWYGTALVLGDGRVLAMAGEQMGVTLTTPEVLDPQTNQWTALPGAETTTPLYPFLFQLPNGTVLWAGASEGATPTKVLNVATQQWSTLDAATTEGGSIRQYGTGKFLKAGSASDSGRSGPSSNTAFTLDTTGATPTWQPTGSMAFPRSFLNLTALPDDTVLVTGGMTDKSSFIDANGVKPAELWNPATGTWTQLASMVTPRGYHSNATLLPDGRVFVTGGGFDGGVTDHKDYEIFSPPYLFKGPRPAITSVPSTLTYWTGAFVGTPDGASIAKVTLVRTGATTHSFDENGRSISLAFSTSSGGITIQTPLNGNVAPPGYYMLFLVNGAGVPSIASMVRLPAPWEVAPPDAGPEPVAEAGPEPAQEAGPEPSTEAGVDAKAETSVDAGADAVADASGASDAGPSDAATGPLAVDTQVAVHQSASAATIAGVITTANPGELLVAFLGSDGNAAQQFSGVAGGSLTWRNRRRQNTQAGPTEIWSAVASAKLTGVTITATRSGFSAQGSMLLVAFRGADLVNDGAVAGASAATGAPTVSFVSTRAGSLVWGGGTDWDGATARTVGTGQTMADQYLSPSGDTYWIQRMTNPTASAGATVTINDTAPTGHRWNLAAIEILPAP